MTRESAAYLLGPIALSVLSDRELFRSATIRAYERGDAERLTQLRALRWVTTERREVAR